jgi:hypothetical protein
MNIQVFMKKLYTSLQEKTIDNIVIHGYIQFVSPLTYKVDITITNSRVKDLKIGYAYVNDKDDEIIEAKISKQKLQIAIPNYNWI